MLSASEEAGSGKACRLGKSLRSKIFRRTQRNRAVPARRLTSGKAITMEDNTPDFDAFHKYLVDNSSEVFTPLIEAEDDDEKRRFYLALQTYSLQQKQRIVLADENFVV